MKLFSCLSLLMILSSVKVQADRKHDKGGLDLLGGDEAVIEPNEPLRQLEDSVLLNNGRNRVKGKRGRRGGGRRNKGSLFFRQGQGEDRRLQLDADFVQDDYLPEEPMTPEEQKGTHKEQEEPKKSKEPKEPVRIKGGHVHYDHRKSRGLTAVLTGEDELSLMRRLADGHGSLQTSYPKHAKGSKTYKGSKAHKGSKSYKGSKHYVKGSKHHRALDAVLIGEDELNLMRQLADGHGSVQTAYPKHAKGSKAYKGSKYHVKGSKSYKGSKHYAKGSKSTKASKSSH